MSAPEPAGPRGLPRLGLWTAGALIFALALFASQIAEIPYRSALRGYDNTFNYLWLRSAMVDGDWNFDNDIAACDTLSEEYRESALALPRTDAGRIPNKYGIGWSVVTLPFYLLADAVVAIGRFLGLWSLERDGFNWVYQVLIQLGHAAIALAGLLLAHKTITRWLGDAKAAHFGVLAVWAGSPLLHYQTTNLSMSHGLAFASVAAMAFALERAGSKDREIPAGALNCWWLAVGAAFGLAVVTRFQLAVFGVVIALTALKPAEIGSRDIVRSILRRVATIAMGAAPLVALQLWAWHVVYGHWLVFSYGGEGEGFDWSEPAVLNSLFSPWHGLFYWHPFLAVAILGMTASVICNVIRYKSSGERPGGFVTYYVTNAPGLRMPSAWVIAVFATIYVNAAWWCWWFASAFGSRAFDGALLPLMAGAAWLLVRLAGRWRTVLCTVAIVAAVWNGYLVIIYRTGAISRADPVTWSGMIAAAARLPESLRF